MERYDYEQVVICTDRGVGLKAIIAIHDTTLGPALGGARLWPYASEEEALTDVLRLSRAMTYKSAAAGLHLGGGKAAIIADPAKDKTEALFKALGRHVHSLGGRYITTEDVGTTEQDMEWIASETPYVTGLPIAMGGSGDPSLMTGFGVYQAMRACAKEAFGTDSLAGRTVALQGFGKVASYLAGHLKEAGARLIVCDIVEEKAKRAQEEFGAEVVPPDEIFDVACDIFSPNALGGVLNSETIPRLKCHIVCGGANNQLLEAEHGEELSRRGILYAPDYVANAGGVINISCEVEAAYSAERARQKTARIYQTMERVIAISKAEGIPTSQAADHIAEERIAAARRVKQLYFE